jgi:hypothetical protein
MAKESPEPIETTGPAPAGTDDEHDRRQRRTRAYLSMWTVHADVTAVPVILAATASIRPLAAVVGRAKALGLCALKGQGLTQHEAFAFADAFDVWDHLTLAENDFVLDPAPAPHDLVQHAWRIEGLWVLEWALGLARHLAFPDAGVDGAVAIERCVTTICGAPDSLALRPAKDLLDGAQVARCLDAVCTTARKANATVPAGLSPGVVFERQSAFAWLIGD